MNNGKTYKALHQAIQALKKFRADSETTDYSDTNHQADLIRTNIVKHTDWEKLNDVINDLGSTLNSLSVQKYVK